MSKKQVILAVLVVCVAITLLLGGNIVGFGIQEYKYYTNYRESDKIIGDVKKNFDYSGGTRDIGGLQVGNYTITTSFGIVYEFHTEDLGANLEGQDKTILLAYDGSKLPQGRIVRQVIKEQDTEK